MPSRFLNRKIGTNTQRVVRVDEMMEDITSWLPRIAAMFGFAPRSRYLKMFSRITMEQSTIMPMPRMRPAMVSMLRVSPARFITKRVTKIEKGIEMPIMIVLFIFRRNRNSTPTARTRPRSAELTSSLIMSRISVVSSSTISRPTSAGSRASISTSFAYTASATATELAPLCLVTPTYTPFAPLIYTVEVSAGKPSRTSPMSRSRMSASPRRAMTVSAMSSTERYSPMVLML